MTSVTELSVADLASAAAVLARGFQNDPMLSHVMPDAEDRRRQLPRFLGAVQRYCVRYGRVDTTSDLAGVACWLSPGATDITYPRMLRTRLLLDVLGLGLSALGRLSKLMTASDVLHHRAVPDDHWYLWLLATEPGRVGQGVGGALMAPVLALADAHGHPVYLETHLEANVGFYGRHRFEVVEDEVVEGLRVWGLRRMPAM
ncbi:MAG TPA: GNAT family N-acetyltransferase [Microlunatus sp.]